MPIVTEPALPPFAVVSPACEPVPIVLSSPHSGRVLPADMLEILNVDGAGLRALDDGPVDQLLLGAARAGAVLLAARYRRVVIDLNRDLSEVDPSLLGDAPRREIRVSARARIGLGLVPSRVGGQPLWRRPLTRDEIERRVGDVWRPYHAQLRQLLDERRSRFGTALLLDCHSMPTLPAGGGRPAVDVALGDRFGGTCSARLVGEAEQCLRAAGLVVARNRPYAGGFITERFGDPAAGISALQIELRRGLFMDEASHVPHAGFGIVPQLLHDLVVRLAACLRDPAEQLAWAS